VGGAVGIARVIHPLGVGLPWLRDRIAPKPSIPFIAAPGNHDTDLANYRRFPDALAYFLYWDLP
jgi:hypothetical protein